MGGESSFRERWGHVPELGPLQAGRSRYVSC